MQAHEFDGPIRNSRALSRRACSPSPASTPTAIQSTPQTAAPDPRAATSRYGEGRAPLRAGNGENGTRQIPM